MSSKMLHLDLRMKSLVMRVLLNANELGLHTSIVQSENMVTQCGKEFVNAHTIVNRSVARHSMQVDKYWRSVIQSFFKCFYS